MTAGSGSAPQARLCHRVLSAQARRSASSTWAPAGALHGTCRPAWHSGHRPDDRPAIGAVSDGPDTTHCSSRPGAEPRISWRTSRRIPMTPSSSRRDGTPARLSAVLRRLQRLLKPGGPRSISTPAPSGRSTSSPPLSPATSFPATTPTSACTISRRGGQDALDVLAVHNDRHSYFLTCKAWAENLEAAREDIIGRWGEALYRRFRLYLWASAAAFRNRGMEAYGCSWSDRRRLEHSDDRVLWRERRYLTTVSRRTNDTRCPPLPAGDATQR